MKNKKKKTLEEISTYNNILITTLFHNDILYYKGSNIAKCLGYVNPEKAIRMHVSKQNKKNIQEILGKDSECLDNNTKMTILIDKLGVEELVYRSKIDAEDKLKKWFNNSFLPEIHNYYLMKDVVRAKDTGDNDIMKLYDKEYKSIYATEDIGKYEGKNMIYMAYVGMYNGEHIIKFGISKNVFRRDNTEHKRNFSKFVLLNVFETDNNVVIEKLFKKKLQDSKLSRKIKINNKSQIELFAIETYDDLKIQIDNLKGLIDSNMLPSLVEAKKQIEEYKKQLEEKDLLIKELMIKLETK